MKASCPEQCAQHRGLGLVPRLPPVDDMRRRRTVVAARSSKGVQRAVGEPGGAAIAVEGQTQQIDSLGAEVAQLLPRAQAGGRKARDALVRLIALARNPLAKPRLISMGVEPIVARLMKSQSSSQELQRLAGSTLTLLTSMPVSSEISEDKSGSHGQVNIVIPRPSRVYRPDKTLLALDAGEPPRALRGAAL